MNNKYQKIFVGFVFALLCVPLTYVIGIQETTKIAGVENITEMPGIQEKSFAKKSDKLYAIIANTIKGKGVSFMENNASWHGKAPKDEELKKALEELDA